MMHFRWNSGPNRRGIAVGVKEPQAIFGQRFNMIVPVELMRFGLE